MVCTDFRAALKSFCSRRQLVMNDQSPTVEFDALLLRYAHPLFHIQVDIA